MLNLKRDLSHVSPSANLRQTVDYCQAQGAEGEMGACCCIESDAQKAQREADARATDQRNR